MSGDKLQRVTLGVYYNWSNGGTEMLTAGKICQPLKSGFKKPNMVIIILYVHLQEQPFKPLHHYRAICKRAIDIAWPECNTIIMSHNVMVWGHAEFASDWGS